MSADVARLPTDRELHAQRRTHVADLHARIAAAHRRGDHRAVEDLSDALAHAELVLTTDERDFARFEALKAPRDVPSAPQENAAHPTRRRRGPHKPGFHSPYDKWAVPEGRT